MPDCLSVLWPAIQQMPVIDTHEHLPPYEQERPAGDVLTEYLSHYLSSDLVSAGLAPEDLSRARDARGDILERWALIEPFWNWCRHTGYARALDLSVQKLYGIDGIHRDTIAALNDRFRETLKEAGHFQRVLKTVCGIETSLLDAWCDQDHFDPDLFRPVWQPAAYICGGNRDGLSMFQWIADHFGFFPERLQQWEEAMLRELDENLAHGTAALKNAMAYERTLHFEESERSTAERCFQDAVEHVRTGVTGDPNFPKPLQDYLMHRLLEEANSRRLVMQVHTGLQEGNGNVIDNSHPSLLSNLFLKYPQLTFDLFHIGYPFQGVTAALAKVFPNVTIDMCWAHVISPAASRAALHDFLDAVPYSKIMGFGGDYLFVDGVVGHLHLAKENIARVLAEKVELAVMTENEALQIAQALLYDNPRRLFHLA